MKLFADSLNLPFFRFVEIGATHYNHLSTAVTQEGQVFMWGQCRGQSVTWPTETNFQSVHDVFAAFASPPVTWRPLKIGRGKQF